MATCATPSVAFYQHSRCHIHAFGCPRQSCLVVLHTCDFAAVLLPVACVLRRHKKL